MSWKKLTNWVNVDLLFVPLAPWSTKIKSVAAKFPDAVAPSISIFEAAIAPSAIADVKETFPVPSKAITVQCGLV